ncbi:MAG: glycosyltransferase family 4 protein [Geminicoccaceae bacterium]
MRVLVLAESAHPVSQSVSWVGWAHTRALAERHDVHLVTRSANREAILAAGWREGRDFTAIDLDALEQRILRLASRLRGGDDKGWTVLMALSLPLYLAFERQAWQRFGDRIAGREFDVVHRITPVSPTMPSLMARRCARHGTPFVLGPLNGGLPWPRQFPGIRHAEREWLSYLRFAYRLAPYYRATREHAAAILVGSRDTYGQLPRRYAGKCVYLPENGIDTGRFADLGGCDAAPAARPRALFVGRLVPYKGCNLALEALAPLLREARLTFTIVGDGPERVALQAQARRLGIEQAVTFAGRVPPDQVARHYREADLFVFPSLREFGGGVVLEAMAMGVVPVVVAYGGPGELVTGDCGLAVPMEVQPRLVASLRAAVAGLLDDSQRLGAMSAAARARVASLFRWERKAEQTTAVYEWVTRRRATKPDFHFLSPDNDLVAGPPRP